MAWYIDAWAVRDGMAFASEREAESLESSSNVFVGPPDFAPMPTSKISTALGAARRGSQIGFRNLDGEEIRFESLEEVIEVVRRGYIGSGRGGPPREGPGEVPLPAGPEPSDEPDEPVPSSERPGQYGAMGWDELHGALCEIVNDSDRDGLIAKLHEGRAGRMSEVRLQVRRFVESTAKLMAQHGGTRFRQDLDTWLVLCGAAGLWDSPNDFPHMLAEPPFYHHHYRFPWRLTSGSPSALLFRVPCPQNWPQAQSSNTVGDHLALAMASRSYVTGISSPEKAAPLIAAALAISAKDRPFSYWWDDRLWLEHAKVAMGWIIRWVPGKDAMDSEVEKLLGRAWRTAG